MSELKCCPFCFGMAELKTADRMWDNQLYCATWVECEVCHSKSKEVWNTIYNDKPNEREKEVIDIWNRRKPMANIVEKLEEKHIDISGNTSLHYLYSEGYIDALDYVSAIVKQEINNGLE